MDIRHDQLAKLSLPTTIELNRGTVARLEDARGLQLSVESGAVWITHEHSGEDLLLQTGQTHRIECNGTTIVSPLGRRCARMVVEPSTEVDATLAEHIRKLRTAFRTMRSRPLMAG